MYAKRIYIENNGPLRLVNLDFPFDGAQPKPLVVVGSNGSGKTNFLSILADALFEAAANHYDNVVPTGASRPWFRVVGSITTSIDAPGSCIVLQLEHGDAAYFFKEKAGNLRAADVAARMPQALRPSAAWADEGNVKQCPVPDTDVRKIFEEGAYVYFPSSRSEMPHWLNRESVPSEEFDLAPRFANRLHKPLFVERGLNQFKQWLLSLLIDVRMEFQARTAGDPPQLTLLPVGNISASYQQRLLWNSVNQILRTILDDSTLSLGWGGRHHNVRLVIHRGGAVVIRSLDALSTGQATLLNIFGTLLRYADNGNLAQPTMPADVKGICIVDEIDAHMHIDLQYRAIPALIKMFPNVQFLVSSHSPIFLLGMEKVFGPEGFSAIEMPTALPIQSEKYAEFDRAMRVIQETKAFNSAIMSAVSAPGKVLVLLEGETDPKYLTAAAELLGRKDLLEKVEFQWIGAKDPNTGQGYHTGKGALDHTLTFFRAKPDLVKRPIVLLYDSDTGKHAQSHGLVHVLSMPRNPANKVAGIENLLPPAVLTKDMYDEKETERADGGSNLLRSLNKMKLCTYLCEQKRAVEDFKEFVAVLDLVAQFVP